MSMVKEIHPLSGEPFPPFDKKESPAAHTARLDFPARVLTVTLKNPSTRARTVGRCDDVIMTSAVTGLRTYRRPDVAPRQTARKRSVCAPCVVQPGHTFSRMASIMYEM
jgi:hypothetical protein